MAICIQLKKSTLVVTNNESLYSEFSASGANNNCQCHYFVEVQVVPLLAVMVVVVVWCVLAYVCKNMYVIGNKRNTFWSKKELFDQNHMLFLFHQLAVFFTAWHHVCYCQTDIIVHSINTAVTGLGY